MKIIRIAIFFLFFHLYTFAQYESNCFLLSSKENFLEKNFEYEIAKDTIINLSPGAIQGLFVSGMVSFNNWNDGYVKITMTDDYSYEYLVYESYPLIADSLSTRFKRTAIETVNLNNICPQKIIITVHEAYLQLDTLFYIKSNKSKVKHTKKAEEIQEEQCQYIIEKLNNHLVSREIPWRAGVTQISLMTYEEKKSLFGGNVPNLGGFDYYVGGVFVLPNFQKTIENRATDSLYVNYWDWRNKHGKNWITPVKNQLNCGSCWAFSGIATVEAYINLYYNKLLNYDLSEQELVSCFDLNHNGCSGGYSYNVPSYIENYGVVMENCFPYVGNSAFCDDKCSNPLEIISLSGQYFKQNSPTEEQMKSYLFYSPLCISIKSWRHAVNLVGYKVLDIGDRIYLNHSSFVTISDSTYVGRTAWIIKNSWGTSFGDNGFAYLLLDINDIRYFWSCNGEVLSNIYNNDSISISDDDEDGYYFWGIGPKPSNCPSWIPDEPDGDDSDNTKAMVDEYGHLYDLLAHMNDTIFINSDTTWNSKCFLYNQLVVQNGATFTVNDTVNFYKDVSITIRDHGKLVINGGRLVNANINIQDLSNTSLNVINNGIIEQRQGTTFSVPIGSQLYFQSGTIK